MITNQLQQWDVYVCRRNFRYIDFNCDDWQIILICDDVCNHFSHKCNRNRLNCWRETMIFDFIECDTLCKMKRKKKIYFSNNFIYEEFSAEKSTNSNYRNCAYFSKRLNTQLFHISAWNSFCDNEIYETI